MAQLTKTIKRKIEDAEKYQDLLETTNQQYQQVVGFYLAIIQFYVFSRVLPCEKTSQSNVGLLDLPSLELLTELERLSHRTKDNPNPPYALSEIAHKLPAGVRRSAINEAIGLAQAWQTSYEKWQARKEKHSFRQEKRAKNGKDRKTKSSVSEANTFPFTEHPPQFPATSKSNLVWYTTEYKLIDDRLIELKVFNGKAWEYISVKLSKTMPIPAGYKRLSPELIQKGDKWYLHQPIQKQVKFTKISKQLKAKKKMKICSVDLGLTHTAVLTVQEATDAWRFAGLTARCQRQGICHKVYSWT